MQGKVGTNGAATPRAPDPEQGNYPMRETEREHTTSRPRLPLGNDFASTIARLKAIADKSTDAALTEGEVSPDRILLDYCADALHLLKRGEDKATPIQTTKNDTFVEELEERPEDVRFMAQFDVLYARDFSAFRTGRG